MCDTVLIVQGLSISLLALILFNFFARAETDQWIEYCPVSFIQLGLDTGRNHGSIEDFCHDFTRSPALPTLSRVVQSKPCRCLPCGDELIANGCHGRPSGQNALAKFRIGGCRR